MQYSFNYNDFISCLKLHRFRLVLLFCCNSLFAQIEKEKTFTDINITEAYREMKNSFSEGLLYATKY